MKKDEISCPHCGKKNIWIPENAFRPFCSERCKLIDLGKWADEKLRIPGEPAADIEAAEELENSAGGEASVNSNNSEKED